MNQSPKKVLFIGCSGIANAHAEGIEQMPEAVQVVMTCDTNREVAESFARRFGADQVFEDYREAISDARGQVDGIMATLPHSLHFEVAKAALEAGLPILIEKPVVCTLAEIRELQALEREGVFVQAAQMMRFGEEEHWLKQWLTESGEFGDPRLFNLDIYQNIEGYLSGRTGHWLLDKKTAGGGIVISAAIHILDLLRFWFDQDFVEIFAQGRFDEPFKNGAESTVAASIRLSGGMIGTLNCSYSVARTPYSQRSLIFGTNGTLCQHMDKLGGGYMGPFFVTSDGGKPSPEWGMMYEGWEAVAKRRGKENQFSPFAHQAAAFAQGIESGKAIENSLQRNFNTIAVIEALAKSLESGALEKVPTV